jgi:hypothetical protein
MYQNNVNSKAEVFGVSKNGKGFLFTPAEWVLETKNAWSRLN